MLGFQIQPIWKPLLTCLHQPVLTSYSKIEYIGVFIPIMFVKLVHNQIGWRNMRERRDENVRLRSYTTLAYIEWPLDEIRELSYRDGVMQEAINFKIEGWPNSAIEQRVSRKRDAQKREPLSLSPLPEGSSIRVFVDLLAFQGKTRNFSGNLEIMHLSNATLVGMLSSIVIF